jgi:hypothetical protein
MLPNNSSQEQGINEVGKVALNRIRTPFLPAEKGEKLFHKKATASFYTERKGKLKALN